MVALLASSLQMTFAGSIMPASRTITAIACAAALLTACGETNAINPQTSTTPVAEAPVAIDSKAELDSLTQTIWNWHLERDIAARGNEGLLVDEIADITPEAFAERSRQAQEFKVQLAAINTEPLEQTDKLTVAFLNWYLDDTIAAPTASNYDFAVTPYNGGFRLSGLMSRARGAPLSSDAERAAYLSHLDELADLIDQYRKKTIAQRDMGIMVPKQALPGARSAVSAALNNANAALVPAAERLEGLSEEAAQNYIASAQATVDDRIVPLLNALLETIGQEYEAAAPITIGLAQYPGGLAEYERRIKLYTGLDMTPQELHEYGITRLAEIEARLADLRDEMGVTVSKQEFEESLDSDPRFFAETPDEVGELYMSHMRRIEPLIPEYFSVVPKAPYGVLRADPAMEASLTFGFFQVPSAAEPRGLYRFNGSGLDTRSQINAASLIYHELIPGHHFHLSLQAESETLPKIRRMNGWLTLSAFVEGWAVYASALANEMGMYADPYDEYGHLMSEAFLTTRIIVDTGTNALGWSLEETREYMAEHTFISEEMIATESLRYSTDIPGQALSYMVGADQIMAMRERMREALGDDFNVRQFHALILNEGSLPLQVLDEHVNWYIQSQTSGSAN